MQWNNTVHVVVTEAPITDTTLVSGLSDTRVVSVCVGLLTSP